MWPALSVPAGQNLTWNQVIQGHLQGKASHSTHTAE